MKHSNNGKFTNKAGITTDGSNLTTNKNVCGGGKNCNGGKKDWNNKGNTPVSNTTITNGSETITGVETNSNVFDIQKGKGWNGGNNPNWNRNGGINGNKEVLKNNTFNKNTQTHNKHGKVA